MHSSREYPLVLWIIGLAKFSPACRCVVGLTIALICVAGTPLACADEGILLDGSRRAGELRFREEAFEFFPSGSDSPLPWGELDRVGLTEKKRMPPGPPFWWQATLANGDNFACQLIEVESNAIICDSTWFQGLRVRRNVIRAFDRPLGWTPWIRQDFTKDARGWKETRQSAEVAPTVGAPGLAVGGPIKTLQFTPESPLPLGKIFLHLHETSPVDQRRYQLRLGIEGDGAFQSIKIRFGGNAPVELQVPGFITLPQPVRPADSSNMLQVEFGPGGIRVSVNELLAAWTEQGFRVAGLRSVALEPAGGNNEADSLPRLFVREFVVARRLEPLPRPPAHPELDEVWLESGDQVFGTYRSISSQFLELATVRDPRKIASSQIRGLYPRQNVAPGVSLPAPWRLTLIDPSAQEAAHFTGVVRSWGERDVVVIHPLLGELKIPRSQIKSIARAGAKSVDSRTKPARGTKP